MQDAASSSVISGHSLSFVVTKLWFPLPCYLKSFFCCGYCAYVRCFLGQQLYLHTRNVWNIFCAVYTDVELQNQIYFAWALFFLFQHSSECSLKQCLLFDPENPALKEVVMWPMLKQKHSWVAACLCTSSHQKWHCYLSRVLSLFCFFLVHCSACWQKALDQWMDRVLCNSRESPQNFCHVQLCLAFSGILGTSAGWEA